MKIIELPEIKQIVESLDLMTPIEQGFIAYSAGNSVTSPVGELLFHNPPGDVHIKSGYIKNNEYYIVKVASGFYDNPKLGLPSNNGLMLLFNQKTGELVSILLDEGYLTQARTAVAGAIVAKYFAPKNIQKIGIVGTGMQARTQLAYLKNVLSCRNVIVWGRSKEACTQYKLDSALNGFTIQTTLCLEELTSQCNFIVTTTPSTTPLLLKQHIRTGMHITAVGADSPHKQELAADIFPLADKIVVDSIQQCCERGDLAHAIKKQWIDRTPLIELGNVLANMQPKRQSDSEITVADLTGLAVQDLQIAKAVFFASKAK